MYSMIFDTETISVGKPFCYDVGYCIVDMDNYSVVEAKHFVVEQIWHNPALFATAYYAEKRDRYVKSMRSRKTIMDKWGYIMREMIKDIQHYEITDAYAYNSDFDDKVFNFNCDWYKTRNPFDNVAIHDIWGYASQFITNREDYRNFCEEHEAFTDRGNYRGNAETVYQFITNNDEFIETTCIRCGKCIKVCPVDLEPVLMKENVNNKEARITMPITRFTVLSILNLP